MLYSVEIYCFIYYFNTERTDPILVRVALVAFLLLDLLATVASLVCVW